MDACCFPQMASFTLLDLAFASEEEQKSGFGLALNSFKKGLVM